MRQLPAIDSSLGVVNVVLQPYFDEVAKELYLTTESQRQRVLDDYKKYIEKEAQATKSSSIRIQLRINLATLIDKFQGQLLNSEVTVKPHHSFRVRVLDGNIFRNTDSVEQAFLCTSVYYTI